MTTRWSARFQFEWTPVLPFARRHAELLDLFELLPDITGFSEDGQHIGVAVRFGQFLIVHRDGFIIDLVSNGDIGLLVSAVSNALTAMQPQNLQLARCLTAWGVPLDGDYNERRAELARHVSRVADHDEMVAVDCSSLVDLLLPEGYAQVEFGIVSSSELQTRLENPKLGRIRGDWARAALPEVSEDDLPSVSGFVDCALEVIGGEVSATFEAVREAAEAAESVSQRVAQAFQSHL